MKKYGTVFAVVGAIACGLGVGYFMQNGRDVPQARAPHVDTQTDARMDIPAPQPAPEAAPDTPVDLPPIELAGTVETEILPPFPDAEEVVALNDVSLTSTALAPVPVAAAATGLTGNAIPAPPADPVTPGLGCEIEATASLAPAAMLLIDVKAQCYPNERVTLHHNGLMFSDTTDADGMLFVRVPALSEDAVVIVAFGNGKGVVAQAEVPELAGYDRVAVQWTGTEGVQIHALEYGAGYGEAGHVWVGSDHTSLEAVSGRGGFVTTLGNPEVFSPQLAEVYTFPSGKAGRRGTVTLSIEAQVTETNCARDITAQMLRIAPGQSLQTRDIALAMPDCTAVGDFLVLNNLVDDLKIAGK